MARPTILLFLDGAAAGVIEATREGETLTGVESQSQKYSECVPGGVPARPALFRDHRDDMHA
jgi:3-oxoacyl-[acyl-carrier-protein] synthase III